MTDFKELLKKSSENDLLIMQNNHTSYTPEEVIQLVKEIDDRGLTSDDSEELKKLHGYTDTLEYDDPERDFEKDIKFLLDKEEETRKSDVIKQIAQITGLIITLGFVFIFLEGPRMMGVKGELYSHFIHGFSKLLPFIIIEFFGVWMLFLTKKYKLSLVVSGTIILTLLIGMIIF